MENVNFKAISTMNKFSVKLLALFFGVLFLFMACNDRVVEDKIEKQGKVEEFTPTNFFENPLMYSQRWNIEIVPVENYSEREVVLQKEINTRVAEGVLSYSPLDALSSQNRIDLEEITPFSWKWVDFRSEDGVIINLRRPNWWIKEVGADSIGKMVYLDIPEFALNGEFVVDNIRVNQLDTRFWEENRVGEFIYRPITGRFQRRVNDYHRLTLNTEEVLRVTENHPFWSNNRNAWVALKDLRVNEQLKTRYGVVSIFEIEKVHSSIDVFNIEVFRDHNYLVGKSSVMAHNNCLDVMDNLLIHNITVRKSWTGGAHFSRHEFTKEMVLDIVSNYDAIYKSVSKKGNIIYRKGGDIVVIGGENAGGKKGQVITAYGSSGVKGSSGVSALGGSASDPAPAVTHEMIINGKVPGDGGSFLPAAKEGVVTREKGTL